MLSTGIYYGSWASKWWGDTIDLENMPPGTGIVYLSFCKPFPKDMFGGLEFTQSLPIIQQSIKTVQAKGILVMLSVGGGAYKFENQAPYADYAAVVKLAKLLGCNGIDIDWEPNVDELGYLPDGAFGPIIHGFRSNGWGGMKLSCAAAPAGAYPVEPGQLWKGLNIKGLISNGHELDWVNIMAYDSGMEYEPTRAFDSFRQLYKGPLYLGIEIGPQGWGNEITTTDDVIKYRAHVSKDSNAGFFVWAFHKDNTGSPTIKEIIEIVLATEQIVATGLVCPNCKKSLKLALTE